MSEHLSDAITPDAVRAVFERQRLGQWSEDEPLQAAFAPESELARAEPPSANTKADPLDALASALVDRLSVVTTASATASATAAAIEQSISQGRELRALVMRAIGGM